MQQGTRYKLKAARDAAYNDLPRRGARDEVIQLGALHRGKDLVLWMVGRAFVCLMLTSLPVLPPLPPL